MADDSKRSNLVDITYQELCATLSGQLEGTSASVISSTLLPRVPILKHLAEPFGTPSDASKAKLDKTAVTLADKVELKVDDTDRKLALALSAKYNIDQVQALILTRSFIYNHGVSRPDLSGQEKEKESKVEEFVETITPFYYTERLSVLRSIIPLFRANEEPGHPINEVADEFLPLIIGTGPSFVTSILTEYQKKTQSPPPTKLLSNPHESARWSKQNFKEQLILLEILFWSLWSFVACDGPTVVKVFETAYSTRIGTAQENAALMVDAESSQLRQDGTAMWVLIMLEVLELERVAQPGGLSLAADPDSPPLYWSSAEHLQRIHELVCTNQDGQYVCVYLAWAFVLARLNAVKAEMQSPLPSHQPFFDALVPANDRAFTGGTDAVPLHMARMCLSPEAGLFPFLHNLLTDSPLFVTSVAWKTGSAVTDPNAVAFRSVIKGLLNALVELVPVEMLPDFNAFTTVFATLYGRSEGASVRGITHQFWISDWRTGRARRAVFDVARARFPLQSRPLVQLLRAMTAFGFLETDALATSAGGKDSDEQMDEERKACNDHVFFFFQELGTYTQVLPGNPPGGLFERIVDRPDQPPAVGLSYTNTQPLRLPGGSTLPARSIGRVLSADGGEGMLIAWEHKHSGWKFLLEVLTDYVYRRRGDGYRELNFHKTGAAVRVQAVTLDDLGLTEDQEEVEGLVVDALDLIRSVMQDDPGVAGLMMRAMESGDPVVTHTAADVTPPDLVQLTTMILEDALSRSARSATAQTLVTSSMGVLAALLPLPAYSNRVWVYLRASSSLFGTDRAVGASSAILLSDRTRGRYTTTLALLHLVRTLFREASAAALVTAVKTPPLQAMKEEVLLRAARFVHAEIWVEYSSWKYAQVSDRFELGRRVSRFFADVLRFAPPSVPNGAFTALGQAVADAFLFSAAQATIGPLVGALTTGAPQLGALSASRRFGDARRLVFLLEAHLALVRAVLDLKMLAAPGAGACLLEQTLCTRATGGMASSARVRSDPVDAVAAYMRDRRVGPNVPVSALWVLHSLSMLAPSSAAPVVAGHLSDPDGVVTGLSKIIQHPYDDPALRFAAWAFVRQTLDTEPALAAIVVDGGIRVPDGGTNGRLLTTTSTTSVGSAKDADGSTFEIACLMFTEWKELWVVNPRLLCALLDFFAAVWAHGMEHRRTLDTKRADALFWDCIAGVISEELGPTPDYRVERIADGESDLHEGVSTHAYRTLGKAHALTIVALDLDMHFQSAKTDLTNKPASYKSIEKIFKSEDALAEQITEAAANIFDPIIQDEFILQADTQFYALPLVSLQAEVPAAQREFGDNFYFSLPLLERRLEPSARTKALALPAQLLTRRLMSINLNMSMAHAQSELTKSWQSVLRRVTPFLRGDAGVRQSFLGLAATVSTDIGAEARPGPMMAAIHAERLALLLALMEVAWFSSTDGLGEIKAFIALVKNVPPILANPAQYPPTGVVDRTVVPLHRTLLQILYFCARHSRSLLRRPKALNAESRLTVTSMVDATLQFVIGGLRVVFDGAEHGLDLDLDKDMELFVVVFEQCTRTDITSSTASWLGRCAEHDVIGASLRLFSNVDLVGFADLALLQAQGRPLYAQHILAFHMALASLSLPAERLASAGLVHAYSNNLLSVAMRAGSIDATLPELPGMRSPAHIVHCTMLAVLAGVLSSAGRQSPALARDVASFVELHADQVIHALEWTIGDGLTLAKIEEIEQVVHLFHALVESVPGETMAKGDIEPILQEFSQRALLLLQQLNYALTHPNHLASLVEPITVDERAALERDAATSTAGPVDSMKRPFLAQLMHRLFRLSTSLLTTLASIGGAEVVLTGDQDDWPLSRATITPHSKVVLSEPASVGTLLELCNCAADLLRRLSAQPSTGQALVPAGPTGEKPLDVGDSITAARHTLEAAALYAVTQLALWTAKPDLDEHMHGDVDADDGEALDKSTSDRLGLSAWKPGSSPEARKSSMSTSDRLRRGMTGEIATDFMSMLKKARPLLLKLDDGKKNVDLVGVLAEFLQQHVSSSE